MSPSSPGSVRVAQAHSEDLADAAIDALQMLMRRLRETELERDRWRLEATRWERLHDGLLDEMYEAKQAAKGETA